MKIQIIYDENQIKKELNFIEECIPYFKRNKMFFYFPFDNTSKKDSLIIDEQIKKDEEKFKIKSTKGKIVKAWEEKELAVLDLLEKYNKKNNCLDIKKEYKCFLMFYGCYGYYDYPDKIFVNINAKIDFILETIIHELIHLFVYEKSQNMKYQEIENLVDSIIIKSGLKNIFTKYEKQIIN
jgi:hypothetical protein